MAIILWRREELADVKDVRHAEKWKDNFFSDDIIMVLTSFFFVLASFGAVRKDDRMPRATIQRVVTVLLGGR